MITAALVLSLLAAPGESAGAPPVRLEVTASAVAEGELMFLKASATVTNAGDTDLWMTERTTARIWGRQAPWIFEVHPVGGGGEGRSRAVHWMCRINERPPRPPRYRRLRPGERIAIELPFPCARLVDAGRYFVTLRFEDREPTAPPAPPGSHPVVGPIEAAAVEVGW